MIQKIKLLFITDDIRLPTGVGIQARNLLQGLFKTGLFDVIQIGGSLIKQSPQPVEVGGVKIYPTSDGYGDVFKVRDVMSKEKPDIVIVFSDPRFFYYSFQIDNEIRNYSKLVLYHTWDAPPFPKYNEPWYEACDYIVTLSKNAHQILNSGGILNNCITHGFNPQDFYHMKSDRIKQAKDEILKQANKPETDFIIFWNNRNIHRKRTNDIIQIFSMFYKTHPNSMLLLNTNPIDNEGNDLLHFLKDAVNPELPIVFNFQRVSTDKLNEFYNMSDVTINIAYNEGFGLCVGESLLCEVPVIATHTGGMPEQMQGEDGTVYGKLLPPVVRELFGVPNMPYIFRDFVSYEQVLEALEDVYNNRELYKELGKQGREYISKNFNERDVILEWKNFLLDINTKPSNYKRYKFEKI